MDFQSIVSVATAFAGGTIGAYFAVRAAIKKGGEIIPGEDALERADNILTEKVDGVMTQLKDLLNPDTNGGVGRGPDNPA